MTKRSVGEDEQSDLVHTFELCTWLSTSLDDKSNGEINPPFFTSAFGHGDLAIHYGDVLLAPPHFEVGVTHAIEKLVEINLGNTTTSHPTFFWSGL